MNSISGLENYQNQLSRITGLSDGQNQTSKTDAKSFGVLCPVKYTVQI